jgi:uncharacterized protein YbjQ (UPF0145 family)
LATDPTVTEEHLVHDLLAGVSALLNQEVDVYEEQIAPTGEVINKKIGTRRVITAANLQAANATINSKAVQKHFAEQKRGTTVNVRKELQRENQKQIEVLDE